MRELPSFKLISCRFNMTSVVIGSAYDDVPYIRYIQNRYRKQQNKTYSHVAYTDVRRYINCVR
jgi:hypothetical protein